MSIDERVRAYALGYAAERAAATEDAALVAFLHTIRATHYSRYVLRPQEVEAYKPGPDGWLTCTLLAPKGKRGWRIKAGWGWRLGRKRDGAIPIAIEEADAV
jgi:hypothetical protein